MGTFGARRVSGRELGGGGRSVRLPVEPVAALAFAVALVPGEGRRDLVVRAWSLLGVPLPMWLCPRSTSYETVEDGRFRFHVEISHPLTGLIVRYRGWLEPVAAQRSSEVPSPAVLSG